MFMDEHLYQSELDHDGKVQNARAHRRKSKEESTSLPEAQQPEQPVFRTHQRSQERSKARNQTQTDKRVLNQTNYTNRLDAIDPENTKQRVDARKHLSLEARGTARHNKDI